MMKTRLFTVCYALLLSAACALAEDYTRYYTDKDVQGKSKDDVQAMLNELYARHGYIFQDATLKSQYEKQSWYKGTESDMSKVEQSFNTYEKKNLEYLTEVRSKL